MKETKTNRQNQLIYWISAAVFVILAFIFYYFFISGRKIKYLDRPIPYIFDAQYHNNLRKYADEEEHKEILLVYGPHGIGKTSGLFEFANELQREGRLVIDIDMLSVSQYATASDVVDFLSNAVIQGFRRLASSPYKNWLLKKEISQFTATASYATTGSLRGNYFSDFSNKQLAKAGQYLLSTIESVNTSANVKALALFDAIESLKDSLRPVIIVHEPWRLLQTEGCTEYCAETTKFFGQLFNGHGNVPFSTGIIFDVANQTKIPLFKKAPYRFVRPYEFDPKLAQHEFVSKERIFTALQFKGLFNLFGGCGVYFSQAYELLLRGYTYSESIEILKDDLKSSLLRLIKVSVNPRQMQQLLLSTIPGGVSKNPSMPPVDNALTQELLARGLFAYASPELDRVEPSTPAIAEVIAELKKSKFTLSTKSN